MRRGRGEGEEGKTTGFPLQAFENSLLEVSEKSETVATQAPVFDRKFSLQISHENFPGSEAILASDRKMRFPALDYLRALFDT